MGSVFNAFCKDCSNKFSFNTGGGFTHYLLICQDCGKTRIAPRRKSANRLGKMCEHEIAEYLDNPTLWSKGGSQFDTEETAIIEKLTSKCVCGGKMLRENDPAASRRCPECSSKNITTEDSGILTD